MIYTNKLNITYDLENIQKDFDIFLLERKSGNFEHANLLDIATFSYKARSVQYLKGTKMFVLFDKHTADLIKLREEIQEEYPDAIVRIVDLIQEAETNLFFWGKRRLAQLLINSLGTPKHDSFSYHNLTGRLLYTDPSWQQKDPKTRNPYMIKFLEIFLDPGLYLNLNVKTFMTKQTHSQRRPYILDPKTHIFRSMLKTDKVSPEKIFHEVSYNNHHNNIEFLNFDDHDKYRKCKLGVMEQFFRDVEKYLGKYMTIRLTEMENHVSYQPTNKIKKSITMEEYRKILIEKGVNLVDTCDDELSKSILAALNKELFTYYSIEPTLGQPDPSAFNIRLIRNENYYQEQNFKDPHQDDLNHCIVQHLTLENASCLCTEKSKKENPMIHKIIEELILKGDVHSREISIYDWSSLSYGKDWTFVRREKMIKKDRKNKSYRYFLLTIDSVGKMKFSEFDDSEFILDENKNRIMEAYDYYYNTFQLKAKKTVEGLVYSDITNIHGILQTREKTLPNIHNLWNALEDTQGKDILPVSLIKEGLESFYEIHSEYVDWYEKVKIGLKETGKTITRNALKKLVNVRTKSGMRFNHYFRENYGIFIYAAVRNLDFSKEYELDNILDIKYFERTDTDGTGKPSLNYFVGPKREGLKNSIFNASVVRQVMAEKEIEFDMLLPLMAVDFVRVGKYTVLPFPFKYLREYMKSKELMERRKK